MSSETPCDTEAVLLDSRDLQEIFTGNEITFSVQGKRYTVRANVDVTPQTTLNTYLRNNLGLKGTKAMCYEGGCGACVVAATVKHPITKQEKTFAVNSCLISVLSCEGWDIHTLEELGNRKDGYHKIQGTLAKFHGSQCGYCSGGMIMNMYALTESNAKLTMKDVENAFGGNLCRCTGYRPILSAFKSLASDADPSLLDKFPDIEDIKICSKTGKQCSGTCKPLEKKPIAMSFKTNDNWYKVYSVTELIKLFYTIGNKSYRLVAGNTGRGVYKIINLPEVWIDVTSVAEFITHSIETILEIGGNVSLTDTMTILLKAANQKAGFWFLKKVHKHLDIVANVPVRNAGTIAGNLSLKYAHNEFPSDVFLLLETIGATLKIVQKSGFSTTKTLVDYLKFDMNKCAIQTITIPQYAQDKYLFESYKICPRVQNAHAYINAAFLVEHDGNFKVKSARIVFGGINPEFIHARNTEAYLVGKNLIDNTTIQGALAKLNDELKPDHILPDASPEFRKNLAMSLFYKFVLASAPKAKVNPLYQSGGARLERELSTGTQIYETHEELYPLTQPVVKLEAMIQCSGEAQYLNDTPPIPGELFGAFVLAEVKPLSIVKNVDTSAALAMLGVKAFISYKDIPGINSFTPAALCPTVEQLFCEEKVLYNGQAIGLILAQNQELANVGAAAVKVTYEATKDIPAFNIEDIRKNKQMWRITNAVKMEPRRKGDAIKHVLKGKFEVNAQYHFTMETQSCICIPTDDGGFDLHSATQWMDNVQMAAAKALNIPMNKINVTVKRLGGGYGAKIGRASIVSTACAIAAYKMNKPVRIQLPIDTNMKMVGKRVPTMFEYEVGTDDDGVIQYLDSTYYQNHALSGVNESLIDRIIRQAQNVYVNDTWKWNGNSIQTDLPGNAFARAPSSAEALGMIESVMEHIAYTLNKEPIDVKLANIQPSEESLPSLLKDMITWSEYEQRKKSIEEFNSKNRWMKKGISLVIMNFPYELCGPFSAFVSVYAGDGTVAISHGGIECGQGINTKVAQVCAYTLGIPLDMVTIKPSNSLNAPNNFATAASMTSEGVCYAVIKACNEIQRRLGPVKAKMNDPTWSELVLQASRESVELCATHMFSAKSDIKPYPIYGLCVSEVEVDVLTGEHNITRVDLIEDVGQSMSPEIDVGQIEGAFVMGLGYYTCENLIYDENGACLTNNTWTYKIPGVKDIPTDFRVKFRQNSTNPDGVLNSKALAEPPLCLAVSIPFAIRRALASARADADPNAEKFVPFVGPTTVEFTYQNAKNHYKQYSL